MSLAVVVLASAAVTVINMGEVWFLLRDCMQCNADAWYCCRNYVCLSVISVDCDKTE